MICFTCSNSNYLWLVVCYLICNFSTIWSIIFTIFNIEWYDWDIILKQIRKLWKVINGGYLIRTWWVGFFWEKNKWRGTIIRETRVFVFWRLARLDIDRIVTHWWLVVQNRLVKICFKSFEDLKVSMNCNKA